MMSKVSKPATFTPTANKEKQVVPMPTLFTKDNYLWMIIGGVIIALGLLLMSGGKNQDPTVFDTNVVYSFTIITVAPILIVGGLIVEIFAIFKKQKAVE